MPKPTIAVLGGTGFVGRHLAARLARDGVDLRVLSRDPHRHRDLALLPGLELRAVDVHDEAALARALAGCTAIVNLVGILNEGRRRGTRFDDAHSGLAATLLAAARTAGIGRLVQVSSLGADPGAPSRYLRSKGRAEAELRAARGLAVTILQPSVIFGPGDSFINRFAALLALSPVLPLARAGARFAPVYVGDVVEAIVRVLADPATAGATLELCGPEVLTLADLVRYTARVTGRRRLVLGLPDPLGWLQAALLGLLPGKPLSLDNFRSLGRDSVCGCNALAGLGIEPLPLAGSVPRYLGSGRREARLAAWRAEP